MIQAVSDSGPLTHLWQIDSWQAWGTFQVLHIAAQVAQEVRKHVPLEQFENQAGCALHIHDIPQHAIDAHPQATLSQHADVATLILAQQTTPELVLTDDLALRRAIEEQGQTPMGSVGILLRAYKAGLFNAQMLNQAIDGLFVHSTLYLSPSFKSYVQRLIAELIAQRQSER
jgi:predicted nucleic acid-binding protein